MSTTYDLPTRPGDWNRAEGNLEITARYIYQEVGPPEFHYQHRREPNRGGLVDDLPRGNWLPAQPVSASEAQPAGEQGKATTCHRPWRTPASDVMFEDGNQYLVAVPVCRESSNPSAGHYYEYSVVTVHCDSETPPLFDVNGGDSWGWDWSDVEAYVPLSEFRIGVAGEQER